MLVSSLGRVFVYFCWKIWQQGPAWHDALLRGDWPAVESEILKFTRLMATEIMAGCLIWYLEQEDIRLFSKTLAEKRGIKTQGMRNVHVTLATGSKLMVRTVYALPERSKKRDYRRWPGSRRPGVKGCYPVLENLGFVNRKSLLYCKLVSQAAVLCPSMEIANDLLISHGVKVEGNKIRTTCVQLGKHMLRQRSRIPVSEADKEKFLNARVVIGIDGGRLRTRKQKKGRRRKLTGHHGFHARWREPKMFVVYTLDSKGNCSKQHLPIHDATLGNSDDVFALLKEYMVEAGIIKAKEIIFVGDGAHWIWDRIAILIQDLGIDSKKVTEVVDFYHACEHISAALDAIPGLSKRKFKRLYRELRSFLAQGKIDRVISEIRLRLPTKSSLPDIERELSYFDFHKERMRYNYCRRKRMPIGSGVIESAIRRVINLRMKAPGTFWKKDTAEIFLYLRSQLISGRWDQCFTNLFQYGLAA